MLKLGVRPTSNTGKGEEHPFRSSHPNREDTAKDTKQWGQNASHHHQACSGGKWILTAETKSFLSYAQSLYLQLQNGDMFPVYLTGSPYRPKQNTGKYHNATRLWLMIRSLNAEEFRDEGAGDTWNSVGGSSQEGRGGWSQALEENKMEKCAL